MNGFREARRTFVGSILDTYPIHPFDGTVAAVHAEVWAKLAAKGTLIGAHDLMMAATALAHDFAVATFNHDDFSRVPGLRVVIPE